MLELKNKQLLTDKDLIIVNSDSIINLYSDIDTIIFGIFTLTDGSTKTIQFLNNTPNKKARLTIAENELTLLSNVTFKLHLVSNTGTYTTNSIQIYFDVDKLKLDVKRRSTKELLEVSKELKLLEKKIDTIINNNRLLEINIVNLDYIKPGMIPVALDDKGNFSAQYPFLDVITNINGQTAVDGVVNIDASMIKYTQDIMLDAYIKQLAETVKAVTEFSKTISQTLMSTVDSLKDLRIKVETHLDNGSI